MVNGKVRVITTMIGDESGSWVSYDDYKRVEEMVKELNDELDRAEIAYDTAVARNVLNEASLKRVQHHIDCYVELKGTITLRDAIRETLKW